MPKYSSFKRYQTITENFRRFLSEDSGEEEGRHYEDDAEEDEKHLKNLERDVRYDKRHKTNQGRYTENEDPGGALEQYIADNPLPGIPPEMSMEVFVMQLQAGVYGRVGSFEEAKDAYDHLRRILDPNDTSHLYEGDGPGFDKIDGAEHARKHWATKGEQEEEEDEELDLMGMQFDASEEQMDWARNMRENKKRKRKGKKTSLLEIKRRRSRVRRKQNK